MSKCVRPIGTGFVLKMSLLFILIFFIKTFVTIAEDIMESFSEKVGEITKLKQNDTIF
jgi:hypothetical protein